MLLRKHYSEHEKTLMFWEEYENERELSLQETDEQKILKKVSPSSVKAEGSSLQNTMQQC